MWKTNDEKTKLARVIVHFDKALDDAFKINISKQIVQLPMQLQTEIKSLADIVRKDSQKKYRKPRQAPATPPVPSPAGGSAGAGSAARNGSSKAPAPAGPTGTPAAPVPRIGVKEVKTDKFVWKVTKGLTGSLDIQVSELNPGLSALVRQIRSDPHALAHLADFLGGLDEMEVQKHLMAERDN